MLIIAKNLANYCVNQISLPDLKYVHLEATMKYIFNIKIKRSIIEIFWAAILKSKMTATWCELQVVPNIKR